MCKKKYIPKEEMCVDGKFYGPQDKHNWLWASSYHDLSIEDLEYLKQGNCIGLNVDDEFVCFICLEQK